jgi:transcriptional regulator with XRE-family HTH domain/DNA-binding XRE family transcriptional regulator
MVIAPPLGASLPVTVPAMSSAFRFDASVREVMGPAFERVSRLADRLQVPRESFYGWVNGRRTIPIETFVRFANDQKLADPSRVFYAFFRRELDLYFDAKPMGKTGVCLVTRLGTNRRGYPIDMEKLRRFGFARVMYEARVRQGLSLDQVADLINELPRKKSSGRSARGDILSQYEKGEMIPQEGHNRAFLDYLIEVLALDPSEAYLSAGRPWVADFIPVFDRADWNKEGSRASPLAPLRSFPYRAEKPVYEATPRPRATHKREATGLGSVLRRARLVTGMGLEEASRHSGISVQSLKNFEIHGLQPDIGTLAVFAAAFGAAIVHLYPYFKDPLKTVIVAHNAHFYPDVEPERFMVEGEALYLACERDAKAALSLMPLPAWNFRRRFFILRLRERWTREEASDRLGVYEKATNKIEDPGQAYFPSWSLVKALAERDKHPAQALEAWRESVQKTFTPEIPWEFLQKHRLFLASPHDVAQLRYYLEKGIALEDRLGWRLFKMRLGLENNESRQEASDRCGVSKSSLTDSEFEKRPVKDKTLEKIALVRGVDPVWLRSLKRAGEESDPVVENPYPYAKRVYRKSVPEKSRFGRLLQESAEYAVFESNAGYRETLGSVLNGVAETLVRALQEEERVIVRSIPLLPNRTSWLHGALLPRLRGVEREDFHVVLVLNDALIELRRKDGRTNGSTIHHEHASDEELYRYEEIQRLLGD